MRKAWMHKASIMVGLVLGAAVAWAQPPSLFPWWEGRVAADLKLSDAQRQQVEAIQKEYRGKMIDGRADMTKAELELDDAMNAEPFDLRKANDAANRAAKARDAMTRDLTQMSLRLRAVLTKEQWQTARTRFGGRGGPGGPGGPNGIGPRGGRDRFDGNGRRPRPGGPGTPGSGPDGAATNQF